MCAKATVTEFVAHIAQIIAPDSVHDERSGSAGAKVNLFVEQYICCMLPITPSFGFSVRKT
jgi:hypothetical protein